MVTNIKIAVVALLSILAFSASAQVCHNLYPYAQGAVDDNNGHDLNGFIKTSSKDVRAKAAKIREYSGDSWGYLQVNNARIPSVDINRVDDKYEKVHLNYQQYIDVTLALYDSRDGLTATWWARQCNSPKGPLFHKKTADDSKLDVPLVWYTDITKTLEAKKFTLIEYNNETYNRKDYDDLLKNYITLDKRTVSEAGEYSTIIDFYNNFLSKFTYVEDPLLEDKSFVTFFSTAQHKFIGYFNIESSKLSGHLEAVTIDYEKDKDTVVTHIFSKLTQKKVYIYGDDVFGMEKTLLRYGYVHNLKMMRRKTAATEKFNKEK